MHIELNENEASALLQIIHIAVKAEGMALAEAGVHFNRKISAAVEAEKQANASASANAQASNGAAPAPKKMVGKESGKEAA